MKKSRFTEEQIIAILREQEAGVPVTELCRKHGLDFVGAEPASKALSEPVYRQGPAYRPEGSWRLAAQRTTRGAARQASDLRPALHHGAEVANGR